MGMAQASSACPDRGLRASVSGKNARVADAPTTRVANPRRTGIQEPFSISTELRRGEKSSQAVAIDATLAKTVVLTTVSLFVQGVTSVWDYA